MNFKKNWKRFCDLSSAREGFTLVELIVVIAILAILAGVAVPAYSGYVKKANMQADITLISEIEHALTLAYYAGELPEGSAGFIMLSPNAGESFDDVGNSLADSSMGGATALAMEKVFGSNWMGTMQLKYDNWGVSWKVLSYEEATTVVNSNFVQKYTPEELMGRVQTLTNAVDGLNYAMFEDDDQLAAMFDYDGGNYIDDVMEDYGISKSFGELTSTERSNLLVLATASSINNSANASAPAAHVITAYSLYTAYAAENAAFNEAYEKFQNDIANVDTSSDTSAFDQIKAAYNEMKAAAGADFDTWKAAYGTQNQEAFVQIMGDVGAAMEGNGDKILGDLNNPNLFTSGVGSELYNEYLDSAYAASGYVDGEDPYGIGDMIADTPEGYVSVYYTVANGMLYVGNTFPLN